MRTKAIAAVTAPTSTDSTTCRHGWWMYLGNPGRKAGKPEAGWERPESEAEPCQGLT